MQIRAATEHDDSVLIRHYRGIWASYGVNPNKIRVDASAVIAEFINEARAKHELGVFLAEEDDTIVGSIACQLEIMPYPEITLPDYRRFGYIWSVFVEPAYRKRGIAEALVSRAIGHLRAIGCTKAVLHASDAGIGVYLKAGFQIAKEMRMDL